MVLSYNDLMFLDKIFSIVNYSSYTDLDKKVAINAVLKAIDGDDIFFKMELLKNLKPSDYVFVTDIVIDFLIANEYKQFKGNQYSAYNSFYKLHGLTVNFKDRDLLTKIKKIWGLDFQFYELSLKNSVSYQINNVNTGWDSKSDKIATLNRYYEEYKYFYQGLEIWNNVELTFKKALSEFNK